MEKLVKYHGKHMEKSWKFNNMVETLNVSISEGFCGEDMVNLIISVASIEIVWGQCDE